MVAVSLGILAAVCFAITDFSGGFAARKNSTYQVVVWSQLLGLVALIPVFAVVDSTLRLHDAVWATAAGIFLGAGLVLLFTVLRMGNVALVSATEATLISLIAMLYAVIVDGDRPKAIAIVGIVFALVALLLTSTEIHSADDIRKIKLGAWLATKQGQMAIGSGVILSVYIIMLSRPHDGAGMWPTLFTRFLSAAAIAAYALTRRQSLSFPKFSRGALIISGITATAAVAAFSVETQRGSTTIAVAFNSVAPAFVALLGFLILRERLTKFQFGGIAAAVIGILLISLGS